MPNDELKEYRFGPNVVVHDVVKVWAQQPAYNNQTEYAKNQDRTNFRQNRVNFVFLNLEFNLSNCLSQNRKKSRSCPSSSDRFAEASQKQSVKTALSPCPKSTDYSAFPAPQNGSTVETGSTCSSCLKMTILRFHQKCSFSVKNTFLTCLYSAPRKPAVSCS